MCLAAAQLHRHGAEEIVNLPTWTTEAALLRLMLGLLEDSKMLVEQYCLFPETLSGTKLMYLILY
jgi:hypothetical protein